MKFASIQRQISSIDSNRLPAARAQWRCARTRVWLRLVVLGAVVPSIALLVTTGAAKREAAPERRLVWPPPPEAARVAFVQHALRPGDLGAKVSGFRRFSNWVTGASTGNEAFSKPFGLALDDADNLCITDTGANAVGYFDARQKKWSRWEKAGDVRFKSPVAVAKRGDTLFVADSTLGAVIAFNTKGKLLFKIEDRLERPSGLTIADGRLLVADAQRHSILTFDLKGGFVSQFGKRGVSPAEFNHPTHVTADGDGFVYVTDSMNCRVQVFATNGQFKSEIGRIGDSPGHFGRPKGVAADRFGHVYVMDALFDTLQIFDREGRFLLNLGAPGAGAGEFWLPNGIAIGRDDRIYVADAYNRRVQVFKYIGKP